MKDSTISLAALVFVALLAACTGRSPSPAYTVEDVLRLNPSLERVLEHCSGDSLKTEAARFLIRNLPYHYGMEGREAMDDYRRLFELHGKGTMYPEAVLDSVRKTCNPFRFGELRERNDVDIDPGYLIDNIEWAFKVWREQPWGKHVPFDMFCEYVLPYRVADEPLEPWREAVYSRFNPLLDSIRSTPDGGDLLKVSAVLLDTLQRMPYYFTGLFDGGPHYGPKVVEWRSGSCQNLTYMTMYVFRALGLPCAEEVMLNRGNGNAAHYWNAVFDNNGRTRQCSVMYPTAELYDPATMWDPKGKVWRRTFSVNTAMQEWLGLPPDSIHPAFRFPCMKDVTAEYAGKNRRRLKLEADRLYSGLADGTVAYICLASRMDWVPVGVGKCEGGAAVFNDVEGDVVLRVATFEGGRLKMQSDPFVLERESGQTRFMPTGGRPAGVKLLHKYNLAFEPFVGDMAGGVFEGSDVPDFSRRDTLHVIRDIPDRLFNVAGTQSRKGYRYVRFRGAKGSHCNISEMSFYQPGCAGRLEGRVIGTRGGRGLDGGHDIENAVDGDPYTSFDYREASGGWVGLDLGRPCRIDRIVFTPRNRDNFIRAGDVYELFHCDRGEWLSAGVQTATSDSLLYTVPEGSLLYLRDHTRGKDERIFEMVDGKQKYW